MITTPPELRALLDDLAQSTWTLAAIGMLFDSGLAEELREPRSLDELAARSLLPRDRIARCLAVLELRGVVGRDGDRYRLAPGAVPFVQSHLGNTLRGEYRSALLQPLAYLDSAARPTTGWQHVNPTLLQAQGDLSGMFPIAFAGGLVEELGDLAARLARPGARFLDVGVGVGSLAIGMCRAFPQLSAVGLDVAEAPLALAGSNVANAGLAERIELRRLAVEELRDEDAFDYAWLPACFIPEANVAAAMARVRASLRPGGWLLMPTMNPGAAAGALAVWSLVNETWGGPVIDAPDAQARLRAAGFTAARTLPSPSWMALVAAQR